MRRGLAFALQSVSSSSTAMAAVNEPRLLGVVFDLDGTLTDGKALDMQEMYARCDVSPEKDILTEIKSKSPEEQQRLLGIIEEMEAAAREATVLATGARDVARWLGAHGVRSGLVSRNSKKTVEHFAECYWPKSQTLWPRLSRDHPFPPKPDPSALQYIADQWNVEIPQQVCMVGDSRANDVLSGQRFGAKTVLLGPEASEICDFTSPDILLEQLLDLPAALWKAYYIDSPLGTAAPLLKFDTPKPSHPSCIAAVQGDVAAALEDLNAADSQTPLVWAADAGQLQVVDALLNQNKVDVNARGYLGATALSRAARNGNLQILARLLQAPDIDTDIPNDKLQFPLHFAAFKQHRDAVRLLLDAGASTTVFDRKGRTPAEDTADPDIRAAILAARSTASTAPS